LKERCRKQDEKEKREWAIHRQKRYDQGMQELEESRRKRYEQEEQEETRRHEREKEATRRREQEKEREEKDKETRRREREQEERRRREQERREERRQRDQHHVQYQPGQFLQNIYKEMEEDKIDFNSSGGKEDYKNRETYNKNNKKRIAAEEKHDGHRGVVIKQPKHRWNLNNDSNLSTIREGNPETSESVKRKLEWK
jgi:hypothetical protein